MTSDIMKINRQDTFLEVEYRVIYDGFFNSNHPLLHNNNIPVFYHVIHQEYVKYFKLSTLNITEVHDHSL